jgi:hypothetical protein
VNIKKKLSLFSSSEDNKIIIIKICYLLFRGKNLINKQDSIMRIKDIVQNNRIKLPEKPGVYAFWWMGKRMDLLSANREIILAGPGGNDIKIVYEDWWPAELTYPCLYIGKSTNIKNRFSKHLRRGSKLRLHHIAEDNRKVKPVATTCQLRHGIEHVFKNHPDPLDLIIKNVGFSIILDLPKDYSENQVVLRFFMEDLLIGRWRPWFNIDSER